MQINSRRNSHRLSCFELHQIACALSLHLLWEALDYVDCPHSKNDSSTLARHHSTESGNLLCAAGAATELNAKPVFRVAFADRFADWVAVRADQKNPFCAKHSCHYYRIPISVFDIMGSNDLIGGLVRLHILHHAAEEEVFGLGLIEELSRHGYRISPGTLYPILHSLEKKEWLKSKSRNVGGKNRKIYRATSKGRRALEEAKEKVRELFGELFEE